MSDDTYITRGGEVRVIPRKPMRTPATGSPDARRTARNNAMLNAGTHPATRLPLADNGHTCGDCVHHTSHAHDRVWHKCTEHALGITHGGATDIRVSWPACTLWAPITLEVG